MPPTYSAKASSIRPYKLTNDQLTAMGRLIRAFAEIEDIVNLRIALLARTSTANVAIFLGRAGLANRLKILKLLSEGEGLQAEELFAQTFDNPAFLDLHSARNTLAHGRLLGLDEAGRITFQVIEPSAIDSDAVHLTAYAYSPELLADLAQRAEGLIPQMETDFGLTALRETRRAQALGPHSKAQPTGQRGSALARQRRASQESARQEKRAKQEAQRQDPKNRKKGDKGE
jgi:hypothetical protein